MPIAFRDSPDAEFVGKIWAAAHLSAEASDGTQPSDRLFKEVHGREQPAVEAQEQRLKHCADETHVVKHWQPADHRQIWLELESVADRVLIREQVTVL